MGPIFSKLKSNKTENLNNNIAKQDDNLESNNEFDECAHLVGSDEYLLSDVP